jgi:hypothetical protein
MGGGTRHPHHDDVNEPQMHTNKKAGLQIVSSAWGILHEPVQLPIWSMQQTRK